MIAFGIQAIKDKYQSSKIELTEVDYLQSPLNTFGKLYGLHDYVFIFESLVGPRELAEISIIGFDPEYVVKCFPKKLAIYDRSKKVIDISTDDPLIQIRDIIPKINDKRFRYMGGAVGYVSYDAIRYWENIPNKNKKYSYPLMEFGIYNDGIIYDHRKDKVFYFNIENNSRLNDLARKLQKTKRPNSRFNYSAPRRNLTKSKFLDIVKNSKKYVYSGDVFQVVLSKSMKFKVSGDYLKVYESLRSVNPSPYMYMFKASDRSIIGSSPEMLLRVTDDYAETFPIAGTRPVVNDEQRNSDMEKDLLSDEKEIAEHTMLVDLARNDLGKVCVYGSVLVNELMKVKRFSHVQHIVSHVTGNLAPGKDCFDAFRAVFPAGTVSGAPKVRAMEIIEDLEPENREPYAGAIGYFSFNGSCDFAITIRSIFINKNMGYLQSGAGIVIESDPLNEWNETEHKANAMISALKKAANFQQ